MSQMELSVERKTLRYVFLEFILNRKILRLVFLELIPVSLLIMFLLGILVLFIFWH